MTKKFASMGEERRYFRMFKESNPEQADSRLIRYNWGVPLEKLADDLHFALLWQFKVETCVNLARELYRGFIRVNPTFWN